jgi:hypothetical protein
MAASIKRVPCELVTLSGSAQGAFRDTQEMSRPEAETDRRPRSRKRQEMRFVALIALAIALAACGSGSNSPKPSSSSGGAASLPAPAVTASPSSTAGTLQGGFGTTKSNPPGKTYGCEFKGLQAPQLVSVLDYVVVTGSSKSPLCQFFGALSNYRPETGLTIPSGSSVCWMTAPDGASTARFYIPKGGKLATTKSECTWQFQDLGR